MILHFQTVSARTSLGRSRSLVNVILSGHQRGNSNCKRERLPSFLPQTWTSCKVNFSYCKFFLGVLT